MEVLSVGDSSRIRPALSYDLCPAAPAASLPLLTTGSFAPAKVSRGPRQDYCIAGFAHPSKTGVWIYISNQQSRLRLFSRWLEAPEYLGNTDEDPSSLLHPYIYLVFTQGGRGSAPRSLTGEAGVPKCNGR